MKALLSLTIGCPFLLTMPLLAASGPASTQSPPTHGVWSLATFCEWLADTSSSAFFQAILKNDEEAFKQLLRAGIDLNRPVPFPSPKYLRDLAAEASLSYYFEKERGFTPLMAAAALGREGMVRTLLQAGADRHAKTQRHKTFALWFAGRHGHVEVIRLLMDIPPDSPARQTVVRIDLQRQIAQLILEDAVIREMPVSTGKPAKPTPPGRYVVTNKYPKWKSTIYQVPMPHFLRLSCRDFGLHAGHLPGYPASSGCIRLAPADAKALFAAVPLGTLVEIE